MAEDLATLKTWLSEALAAQHSLSVGSQTVSVKVDGSEVTYTAASSTKLSAYIADLRSRIAEAGGSAADGASRRRSFKFFVGR